jgi:hypothetical protein
MQTLPRSLDPCFSRVTGIRSPPCHGFASTCPGAFHARFNGRSRRVGNVSLVDLSLGSMIDVTDMRDAHPQSGVGFGF